MCGGTAYKIEQKGLAGDGEGSRNVSAQSVRLAPLAYAPGPDLSRYDAMVRAALRCASSGRVGW